MKGILKNLFPKRKDASTIRDNFSELGFSPPSKGRGEGKRDPENSRGALDF